nr:hypothetical protein BaRGS_017072 [Batillaria attramentaria]
MMMEMRMMHTSDYYSYPKNVSNDDPNDDFNDNVNDATSDTYVYNFARTCNRPKNYSVDIADFEYISVFASSNADHLYAQVKKPKARNAHSKDTADGNNAANTTKPDTALYQVATVPVGEFKTGEDGDYNTVGDEVARNTFPNNNGKDSGYELATASQTTAVYGAAKASLGGNNARLQEQNEYNKLSHQPPHTAPSARTNHAYDHLAGQQQCVPPEQTAGGVYSLAKADDFADVLSRSRKGKDDYINVNPDLTTTQSTREAEYNRLDFDDDHPRGPAAGGHVAGRARDVYNHLQAGAEGFQGSGDGDQYNSLDFDGQDHKQQVIEGAEYSHLASEDA